MLSNNMQLWLNNKLLLLKPRRRLLLKPKPKLKRKHSDSLNNLNNLALHLHDHLRKCINSNNWDYNLQIPKLVHLTRQSSRHHI
jgi:hypothetical protein